MSRLEEVGIDYCITHASTRNEDEPGDWCDWYAMNPQRDSDAPCELVPLGYTVEDEG